MIKLKYKIDEIKKRIDNKEYIQFEENRSIDGYSQSVHGFQVLITERKQNDEELSKWFDYRENKKLSDIYKFDYYELFKDVDFSASNGDALEDRLSNKLCDFLNEIQEKYKIEV